MNARTFLKAGVSAVIAYQITSRLQTQLLEPSIDSLVDSSEFRSFYEDTPLGRAAYELNEKLKGANFIIGYGSWVYGTEKKDSMKDFIVVVGDTAEFYSKNEDLVKTPFVPFVRNASAQNFINKLGPNYYHLGHETKIGVVSMEQFITGGTANYVGFRLTKPLAIYSNRDPNIARFAVNRAREETLERALSLMPEEFTLQDFALQYLGVSYKADIRPEDPRKVQSTYDATREQTNKICSTFLNTNVIEEQGLYLNPNSSSQRFDELLTLSIDKGAFGFQSLCNFFTAADPIGYFLRKVRVAKGD